MALFSGYGNIPLKSTAEFFKLRVTIWLKGAALMLPFPVFFAPGLLWIFTKEEPVFSCQDQLLLFLFRSNQPILFLFILNGSGLLNNGLLHLSVPSVPPPIWPASPNQLFKYSNSYSKRGLIPPCT